MSPALGSCRSTARSPCSPVEVFLSPDSLRSVASPHPRALLLRQPEHKGSNRLSACHPGLPRIRPRFTLACSLIPPCCYYHDSPTPFHRGKLLPKSDVQANLLYEQSLFFLFPTFLPVSLNYFFSILTFQPILLLQS